MADEAHSAETADTKDRVLVAFKPACVFDISMTDGEDLPEPCTRLQGDAPADVYDGLVKVADGIGFTVEDHDFADSTNGDCTYDLHRIRVRTGNSQVQRVKTLAHELAHAMLHEHHENRALAELEAESVAYVVCANLGINSEDYTLGYVATWAGGGDEAIAAIKASAARIQQAADKILGAVGTTEAQEEHADEAA